MSKVKAVNYSVDQIATMSAMYTGEDNIAEVRAIASAIDKPVNSVRAKLSSMGVYVRAEAVKTVSNKVTKEVKATQIAGFVDLSEAETLSLSKTTGAVLDKLLARLTS